MAEQWFYRIIPEIERVERLDENNKLLGFMDFAEIARWKREYSERTIGRYKLSWEDMKTVQLYFIAYDELIDRGLVKEEE